MDILSLSTLQFDRPATYSFAMDRNLPVVQALAIDAVVFDHAGPPPFAASSILSVTQQQFSDRNLDQLVKEGYSSGLITSMAEYQNNTAKQIWLIDDSGSMITYDGTRMAKSPQRNQKYRFVRCSRWEEVQDTVKAHIRLAGTLRFPTSFRFLNGWQSFGVCETLDSDANRDVQNGLDIVAKMSPDGPTPLKMHVKAIREEVESMKEFLCATGQHVSIVLCTDGLPSDTTDDDFIKELRRLESLPVWIVIRLCTNELDAVQFYNKLDAELEVPVDVVDDFLGEGIEVANYNPWLNYAMPLHKVREMGVKERVLDLLDERPLSPMQQREVCTIIFGEQKMKDCPDPAIDWLEFVRYMDDVLAGEQLQWDPISKKMRPWINFGKTKSKQRQARKIRKASILNCFGR